MKVIRIKLNAVFLMLMVSLTFTACSTLKGSKNLSTVITVSNKSSIAKTSETVEIAWNSLNGFKDLNPKQVIVKAEETGMEIPSQVIYNGEKFPQSIIFQTDVAASATKKFIIISGVPSSYIVKVYGRQVPERFDDFAWENDKVAFRMYGEALESKSGMAKGIDFWAKRTSDLVINKWYKSDNYHHDNGDGVDAYHVGMTLGAGSAEPIVGDDIIYPINYSSHEILDQGPIRISFKLVYKPFKVNNQIVKETKIISLDAGSQINKIVNKYEASSTLDIAAGVTKHKNDGVVKIDSLNQFVAYWDKADGDSSNGFMGVGVIYPLSNIKELKQTKQHLLIIANTNKDNEFCYYQGGGWSKSGNFNTENDWFSYLKKYSANLKQPLIVKVK